jgi:hypothetical protein
MKNNTVKFDIAFDMDGVIAHDLKPWQVKLGNFIKSHSWSLPFVKLLYKPYNGAIVITGRHGFISEKVTRWWLKKHNIKLKEIHFNPRGLSPQIHKARKIIELEIDCFYESCPIQTEDIKKYLADKGHHCEVRCFNEKWNKGHNQCGMEQSGSSPGS